MMRSLARYATANAVTRTMLSEFLTKQEFDAINRTASLQEAWAALRRTRHGDWLPQDSPTDVLALEQLLREATALRFKRSIRTLKGKPKEVGTTLLSRWDLDNLEFALRLWHGRDSSLVGSVAQVSFVHEIPSIQIAGAQTIEEIALALRHTPYFEPVSASVATYREKHSIFYVEVTLERDYYRRLLQTVRALGGHEALEGERIIASEIDLLNLSWVGRLLQYYGIRAAELHQFLIPSPSVISRQLTSPGLTADALNEIGSKFFAEAFRRDGKRLSTLERVSLLEYMVSEMAVQAARRSLAGYPFSITCILSFYLLKRVELRNLTTSFVGKASGLTETEISRRLYGLR